MPNTQYIVQYNTTQDIIVYGVWCTVYSVQCTVFIVQYNAIQHNIL